MISVDDHVVEPPHTFEGRLPAHLQDRAPRVADTPQGLQIWEFEDQKFTQVGMNAIAGRRPTQKKEPFRFDEMRPSCYDADARVRDMDINGIWAAVNFPSMVTGFCGRVLFNAQDRELGQACIRAWNDWLYEEWYLPHPDPHHPARDRRALRSRTPRSPRSTATPSAGSPRSPCRNGPTSSVSPTSGSATTGTRSSRRASTPTPCSRSTSAAPAAPRAPRAHPASRSAPRCSASSRCTRPRNGCGRSTR